MGQSKSWGWKGYPGPFHDLDRAEESYGADPPSIDFNQSAGTNKMAASWGRKRPRNLVGDPGILVVVSRSRHPLVADEEAVSAGMRNEGGAHLRPARSALGWTHRERVRL